MKLTKNFRLSEFILSDFFDESSQLKAIIQVLDDDKILDNIKELASNLQVLRDELNTEISINIGFRPVFWELLKSRSGNSKHCLGQAGDLKVKGFTPKQVADTIEKLIKEGKMHEGGIGRYNTFTHYDIRGTKARWNG